MRSRAWPTACACAKGCRRASRAACRAAPLCLNMDHFRRINDMFGHGTGDWVLREVALRLRRLVREGDLVARTGGDEFALLVDGVGDEVAARRFAQRMITELARPFPSSVGTIAAGASVGIVLVP